MLAPFVVVPTNVTELPELLSVVMLPFRVVNVPEVIATVLMLPLPPMAPTATVLAEPPDEVMVTSREPEAAVMVPILIAPPAEVTLNKFVPTLILPKLIASLLLTMGQAIVTVPPVFSVTPPLKVKVSDVVLPKLRLPVFWKVTALAKVALPLKKMS